MHLLASAQHYHLVARLCYHNKNPEGTRNSDIDATHSQNMPSQLHPDTQQLQT